MNKEQLDSMNNFVKYLNASLDNGTIPATIASLQLPVDVESTFKELINEVDDEEIFIVIYLQYLITTPFGEQLTKQAKRVINKAYKMLQIDVSLLKSIENRLKTEFACGLGDPREPEIQSPHLSITLGALDGLRKIDAAL